MYLSKLYYLKKHHLKVNLVLINRKRCLFFYKNPTVNKLNNLITSIKYILVCIMYINILIDWFAWMKADKLLDVVVFHCALN